MSSKQKGVSRKGEEPKRPMGSYFMWLQENREELKEQLPHSNKSFAKRAAGVWQKLEDKSHWQNLAREAMEEYEETMKEFEEGGKVTTSNNKRKQPEQKNDKKKPNDKKTKKDEEAESSEDED